MVYFLLIIITAADNLLDQVYEYVHPKMDLNDKLKYKMISIKFRQTNQVKIPKKCQIVNDHFHSAAERLQTTCLNKETKKTVKTLTNLFSDANLQNVAVMILDFLGPNVLLKKVPSKKIFEYILKLYTIKIKQGYCSTRLQVLEKCSDSFFKPDNVLLLSISHKSFQNAFLSSMDQSQEGTILDYFLKFAEDNNAHYTHALDQFKAPVFEFPHKFVQEIKKYEKWERPFRHFETLFCAIVCGYALSRFLVCKFGDQLWEKYQYDIGVCEVTQLDWNHEGNVPVVISRKIRREAEFVCFTLGIAEYLKIHMSKGFALGVALFTWAPLEILEKVTREYFGMRKFTREYFGLVNVFLLFMITFIQSFVVAQKRKKAESFSKYQISHVFLLKFIFFTILTSSYTFLNKYIALCVDIMMLFFIGGYMFFKRPQLPPLPGQFYFAVSYFVLTWNFFSQIAAFFLFYSLGHDAYIFDVMITKFFFSLA